MTFTVSIINVGETNREEATPLLVSIEGAEPMVANEIPPLNSGAASTVLFDVRLDPGQRQLQVAVDESVSNVAMEILASNVSVAPVSYQVIEEDLVEVKVDISNLGSSTSGPVDLVAMGNRVATVRPLQIGETEQIAFSLMLPTGRHDIDIAVSPDPREVDLSDNSSVITMDVEYVSLNLQADSANTVGYNRDGSAEVHVNFIVSNIGVAPSGEFEVAAQCVETNEEICLGTVTIQSLMPGESFEGQLVASLPQGITPVHIYAGELDDGYRWGDANVYPITVEVPTQPEIDLVLQADTTMLGYYRDGSAGVKLSVSIRNDGSMPVEGTRDVLVSCRQGEEIVTSCSGLMTVDLGDGYGPASSEIDLIVPTGEVELVAEGVDISFTRTVSTPERIIVSQPVWRCASDENYSDESPRGSCGGLRGETFEKWRTNSVITFWADGNARYIEVFEDVIAELAPMLNINLQRVTQEEGADLVVHVGITPTNAVELGYMNCEGMWGCANHVLSADGFIESAVIVVFENVNPKYDTLQLTASAVEYATKHQILRALVPIGYRNVPDSILSIDKGLRIPDLSKSDIELLNLYTNPLIESGMTLDEVEEILIFENQLLEQLPEEELQHRDIILEAFSTLHEAESALYEMQGTWSGGTCLDSFKQSQVTIANFSPYRALQYRFVDAGQRLFHFRRSAEGSTEYWDGSSRSWETFKARDEQELIRHTNWNPEYSDPLIMLASILWFAPENRIEVTRESDLGWSYAINLDDAFVSPGWSTRADLDITISIDATNHRITEYSMDWDFAVRGLLCNRYYVEAELIQYGASMVIPSTVRNGSSIIE